MTYNLRQTRRSYTTIYNLPKDLLIEIIAKVAANSISDLHKAKVCCKDFLHATDEDYIYQHATLEKFNKIHPSITDKTVAFFKRCMNCGNLESFLLKGMRDFFTFGKIDSGLESIKKAFQGGNTDAMYIYGMIHICSNDEEKIKEGLTILRSMRMSTTISIVRSRDRVLRYYQDMWVRKRLEYDRRLCYSHPIPRRWTTFPPMIKSPPSDDDENKYIQLSCDFCLGDHELQSFRGCYLSPYFTASYQNNALIAFYPPHHSSILYVSCLFSIITLAFLFILPPRSIMMQC